MGDSQLDRFTSIEASYGCQDGTYVSGYKIWQHELVWQSCRREPGTSFLALPMSDTATPIRDFYILSPAV